jgi:hypothetical protein
MSGEGGSLESKVESKVAQEVLAKVMEVIVSSVKVDGYKFDIPKFDGQSDYVLWERQVNGALKASRLGKVLRPKPEKVNKED